MLIIYLQDRTTLNNQLTTFKMIFLLYKPLISNFRYADQCCYQIESCDLISVRQIQVFS